VRRRRWVVAAAAAVEAAVVAFAEAPRARVALVAVVAFATLVAVVALATLVPVVAPVAVAILAAGAFSAEAGFASFARGVAFAAVAVAVSCGLVRPRASPGGLDPLEPLLPFDAPLAAASTVSSPADVASTGPWAVPRVSGGGERRGRVVATGGGYSPTSAHRDRRQSTMQII
jgi:hypothetical protein